VHYGVLRTNSKSISQEYKQVKMREAAHAFFLQKAVQQFACIDADLLMACVCDGPALLFS
jgi:hypothetical protein